MFKESRKVSCLKRGEKSEKLCGVLSIFPPRKKEKPRKLKSVISEFFNPDDGDTFRNLIKKLPVEIE